MKHDFLMSDLSPLVDMSLDETMAMVYVGDVYSLVVQEGAAVPACGRIDIGASRRQESPDDRDALWPYIR